MKYGVLLYISNADEEAFTESLLSYWNSNSVQIRSQCLKMYKPENMSTPSHRRTKQNQLSWFLSLQIVGRWFQLRKITTLMLDLFKWTTIYMSGKRMNETNDVKWWNDEKCIKCKTKVCLTEWPLGLFCLPLHIPRHTGSLSVSQKSLACSGNMFPFGLFLFPSCLCSSCLVAPDLSLIIPLIWKLSMVTESSADRVAPAANIRAFWGGTARGRCEARLV